MKGIHLLHVEVNRPNVAEQNRTCCCWVQVLTGQCRVMCGLCKRTNLITLDHTLNSWI